MNTCDQIREHLQARAEGELPPRESGALDAHLSGCAACAAEHGAWLALLESLEALPPAPVPEGFAESVMRDLPEMLPAREGPRHLVGWGVVVTAILSAFVAMLGTIHGTAGAAIARETLQPLAGSLHLGGLMVAHAATATLVALRFMSEALAGLGPGGKLAFILAFAAVNASLFALIARCVPAGSLGNDVTRR